jgi:hypothetical protein
MGTPIIMMHPHKNSSHSAEALEEREEEFEEREGQQQQHQLQLQQLLKFKSDFRGANCCGSRRGKGGAKSVEGVVDVDGVKTTTTVAAAATTTQQ